MKKKCKHIIILVLIESEVEQKSETKNHFGIWQVRLPTNQSEIRKPSFATFNACSDLDRSESADPGSWSNIRIRAHVRTSTWSIEEPEPVAGTSRPRGCLWMIFKQTDTFLEFLFRSLPRAQPTDRQTHTRTRPSFSILNDEASCECMSPLTVSSHLIYLHCCA